MTREREPARLRKLEQELPAELVLALEDAPEDNATPAELALLAKRVRGALAAPTHAARSSGVPRRSAPRGPVAAVVLTFALGAAAGVLASGGVFLALRSRPLEAPPSVVASASVRARSSQPRAAAAVASAAPAASSEEAPLAAPRPARDLARLPAPSSSAELSADSSPPPELSNREELALLARAQAALASNPVTALGLTRDHERKFPHGLLVQEREVVAIDALLRLGRRAEAAGRAVRFHEQFPTSVHGRRLDVLLGKAELSGADHN